jgi:hypothetical protein
MPFDSNSPLNFSEYKTCLQIVSKLYHFYTIKKHIIFLLGDWNADILGDWKLVVIVLIFYSPLSFQIITYVVSHHLQQQIYFLIQMDHAIYKVRSLTNIIQTI